MSQAEALVREMEEEGIDAPIDIYHSMMDGYTIVGNEEKCLIVFDRLKVKVYLREFSLCEITYKFKFYFFINLELVVE